MPVYNMSMHLYLFIVNTFIVSSLLYSVLNYSVKQSEIRNYSLRFRKAVTRALEIKSLKQVWPDIYSYKLIDLNLRLMINEIVEIATFYLITWKLNKNLNRN